ncbi:MAG: M16 family metallopeptidase [Gemmatimonadaceae bacterium]
MRLLSRTGPGLLALLFALLAAGSASAQRATLEHQVVSRTLPNGLTVVVAENHAVPLATIEVVVRGGAITQQPDEQGVPHLFEHMLFRSYRDAGVQNFGEAASRIDAGYNGTTSEESVTYYATVPAGAAQDAVGLLAHLVIDPRFRKEDLQTERQVVFGEFNRDVSDPRGQLNRALERLLWGDSYYRKNTLGDATSIWGATPERLTTIYKRYYLPNNAAIVVTGDVAAPTIIAEIEKKFADWKRGADPATAYPVPEIATLAKAHALVMNGDVNDITIMMMWPGPRVTADSVDGYSADVVSEILDDPDSDFQQRLVDSGLFSHASVQYLSLAHVGPITFVGTTTRAKLDIALTALSRELTMIGDSNYFSESDLAFAKKRRAVETAMELETSDGMAQSLSYWWAVTGLDHYYGYVDNLDARTTADLHSYVKRYIVQHPFVMGALTPDADAKVAQAFLQQFIDFSGLPQ